MSTTTIRVMHCDHTSSWLREQHVKARRRGDRMITAEPYEFEGERFVKLTSELGSTMDVTEAEHARFAGYPLRDYDHTVAALRQAWLDQGISQRQLGARIGHTAHVDVSRWLSGARQMTGPSLFDLAYALGYDLALIPRETE